MAKNRNRESINKTSMGILEGLSDLNNLENEQSVDNKNDKDKIKSNIEVQNKDKIKLKNEQEKKSKRSFMLTDRQIEMVYLLKAKNPDKDLSTLVGKAIEEYYESKVNN